MLTTDELAGVVELFGALRRPELEEALSELAYRRGEEPPEGLVDAAIEEFVLVAFEADGDGARVDELLDVSYDLESWTPVDLEGVRERLRRARE